MKTKGALPPKLMYAEGDFLQLSGIQHFSVCRRQWALIHIEQVWKDSIRTKEGDIVHEHVDNPDFIEKRGDILISRAMPICSHELGLSGICDAVEFKKSDGGVSIRGRSGQFKVSPIEYKVGSPKKDNWDAVQLCAQAMALEEMLGTRIEEASLYYAKTRRRTSVVLDNFLRNETKDLAKEMHEMFKIGITPPVIQSKICGSCSLKDLCMPCLLTKMSIFEYMKNLEV